MPSRLNPQSGRGYRFIDRVGMRLGRLVFTRPLGLNRHKHRIWEALCDCGRVTTTTSPHMVRSCGCLQREAAARAQRLKAMSKEEKARRVRANADRQRRRRRSDPVCLIQERLSRLMALSLQKVGGVKTSPTVEMLGFSAEELRLHIERQFLPGMSWDNRAKWHLDHIVPTHTARTVDDVIALNQLSNLRPLWSAQNLKKQGRRLTLL